MKGLADSKIYEQELKYWPYKYSIKKVIDYICKNVPSNGTLIDLMCGPGYLLGQIASRRKDLVLKGLDIDKRYINYARKKYPQINFQLGNILSWKQKEYFDAVICTGSLHHIPYDKQEKVVKKMASLVKPDGFVIISDSYLDKYSNERQRKLAAAKLGYEYLKQTIKNKAPQPAVESTVDILWNDVLMKEFKTSLKRRLPIFEKYFSNVKTLKTWPKLQSEYGDYISICKKAKRLNLIRNNY